MLKYNNLRFFMGTLRDRVNSHLPIDKESMNSDVFKCEEDSLYNKNSDLCLLSQVHYSLFSNITEIAMNPEIGPTRFILVGDHNSHFFKKNNRNLFIQNQVPVIDLYPTIPH